MQTDGADATDPRDLVLDAAAVLHASGQSTGMTLAAVDRLNEGLGTTGTLVPTWASLQLVGPRGAVRVAAGSPTGVNMRRVAATMTVVDRAQDGPLDAGAVRGELASARAATHLEHADLQPRLCHRGGRPRGDLRGAASGRGAGRRPQCGTGRARPARCRADCTARRSPRRSSRRSIAGLVGVVADRLHVADATGLVVLCPAMVLVPGPHILNGALDLLSLRMSLGMARLGFAALVLTAVATGLILGLAAGGLEHRGGPVGRARAPSASTCWPRVSPRAPTRSSSRCRTG